MNNSPDANLPYGIFELQPNLVTDPGPPLRVRCCVRRCDNFLIPPSRAYPGQVCRKHGIRTHRSATYSYVRPERNIITTRDVALRIARHPCKYECRFQLEKSEDALVYCALRSFMEARHLNYLARFITGLDIEEEPRLILWGIEQDEALTPFNLLVSARERFESHLPVERPKSEPDCLCYLPGHYLIVLEAKFTSPNPLYTHGPRRDDQSLTFDELLNIYQDPLCPMLDLEKARQADAVAYQMFRYVQIASWMAHHATPGTKAYFVNLTRRGHENESFNAFSQLVRPEFLGRITHFSWEDLWVIAGLAGGKLCLFREYMVRKSSNLLPAFNLGLW